MTLPLRSLLLVSLLWAPLANRAQTAPAAPAAIPDAPQPTTGTGQTPQNTAPSSSSEVPQTKPDQQKAQTIPAPNASTDQLKAEEKQRMLGIVPEFNTVNGENALPLTKGQKFELWYKSSIDPFTFATAGLDAGIEQAENSYPGYHQGAKGFAKRYGAAYADGVDGNLWGNAILPVLLHQDPRYFRLGHGSFKGRLWYAAISTVRTKSDAGKWQPAYSNVGGNLIAGAISNLYYPASDRGVGLIFQRGFTVTAEGALGSLAYEFYPDAIAYLKRHHHRQDTSAVTTPSTATPSR